MKLKAYPIVADAVAGASRLAYRYAYKHLENGQHPTEWDWAEQIENAVMNALCEIIDFKDEELDLK